MPTIDVPANELRDVKLSFVSLVKRGASRLPFRITKGDAQMGLDLSTSLRKQEDIRNAATTESARKAEAIQKSIEDATALMESQGFTVTKTAVLPADGGAAAAAEETARLAAVAKAEEAAKAKKLTPAEEEEAAESEKEKAKEAEAEAAKTAKKADEAAAVAETERLAAEAAAAAVKADVPAGLTKADLEAVVAAAIQPLTAKIGEMGTTISTLGDRVAKAETAVSKQDAAIAGFVPGHAPADPASRTRKSESGSLSLPPIDTAYGRVA